MAFAFLTPASLFFVLLLLTDRGDKPNCHVHCSAILFNLLNAISAFHWVFKCQGNVRETATLSAIKCLSFNTFQTQHYSTHIDRGESRQLEKQTSGEWDIQYDHHLQLTHHSSSWNRSSIGRKFGLHAIEYSNRSWAHKRLICLMKLETCRACVHNDERLQRVCVSQQWRHEQAADVIGQLLRPEVASMMLGKENSLSRKKVTQY